MSEVWLECINCGRKHEPTVIYRCEKCNDLLDVRCNLTEVKVSKNLFDSRSGSRKFPFYSGVWRFRELVHPLVKDDDIVSRPEGNTNLYTHERLDEFVDVDGLILKHEGENPTGSFKDRGMTGGISEAKRQNAKIVTCASTGNTSASLAAYAAMARMRCIIFIPEGEIAYGKLSQALAYGATVLQIKGSFDDAMRLVQESSRELGMYLLNSVNPWRIEGQKSIMYELIQQLDWNPPDWIVVPAGNLGNTSAFGKALKELKDLGLIDELPKLASIQAEGANPFYQTWKSKSKRLIEVDHPETVASAIKIGRPVSWKKALRSLKLCEGVVEQVSDQEIMDAKAIVDKSGIGCEPASAASVAGTKKLRESGMIDRDEKVICILTGNILKDPDATIEYHTLKVKDIKPRYANKSVVIEPQLGNVRKIVRY